MNIIEAPVHENIAVEAVEEVPEHMLDRLKKGWKANKSWVMPLGIALIILFAMYALVNEYVAQNANDHVEDFLEDLVEQQAEQLSARMNLLSVSGETALLVGKCAESMQAEDWQEAAAAVKKVTECTQVLVAGADGKAVTSDGEEEDLSEDAWFQKLSSGQLTKPQFDFREVSSGDGSEESILRIAVPVSRNQGEEQIYLICTESAAHWLTEMQGGNVQTVYCAVFYRAGTVAAFEGTVSEEARENIWMDLQNDTGMKQTDLRKKFYVNRASLITCNDGAMVMMAPISKMDDLFLIAKVSSSTVEKLIARETRSAKGLLTRFWILIVCFVAFFGIFNWARHTINAGKAKKLEKSATTDPLTGLKNKSTTRQEISRYMQNYPGQQGMMFLLDIDDFKTFNDSYGHAFGDQVLQEFSFNLSSYFRAADIIGRIGGDEFMVFCGPITDDYAIERKLENLNLFAQNFAVGEETKRRVSSSIGVAFYPADGEDFEALYKAADQAMYRAKKAGKARVSK